MTKTTKPRTVAKSKAKPVRRNRVKDLEAQIKSLESNLKTMTEIRDALLSVSMQMAGRMGAARAGLMAIHAMANSIPATVDEFAYIKIMGQIGYFSETVLDHIRNEDEDYEDDLDL